VIRPYYVPGPFYPGPRAYGYRPYGVGSASGIKFDLDQISKGDRVAVGNGEINIPDNTGKMGYVGTVKAFSGRLRQPLPFAPGNHVVTIYLADGRAYSMSIIVQPGRVTTVSLRSNEFFEPAPEPTHK
jgi:hypothetical protein